MAGQSNNSASTELLAAIVNSSEDAIIGSDLHGHIISWNHAATLLFGHAHDSILGQAFALLFPDGQLPDHLTLIQLLEQNSAIGQFETMGRHADGREIPVSLSISAIRHGQGDSAGKIFGLALSARDFSNGYKLAARLAQSERHFRQVVNAAPNAMVLIDQAGVIEMINDRGEKIFGYPRAELVGQPFDILVPARFRGQHAEQLDQPAPTVYALRKDGTEFPVEVSLNPIDTSDGVKVLSAIVDISERQHFIDELSRRNQELKDFAYVASHDLKAPLRGVSQLATWITEDLAGQIKEETREHLHLLRVRITRMEKLLEDLLLYFRADQLGGNIVTVDFAELVRDVFDLCCSDASFDLELQGNFPKAATHRVALELVLRNLISNAIKHHDKRSGHIIVRSISSSDEEHYIFEVADDGAGIPPEHRERVFAMFQTLRPRDEVEGSGMGLAVIRKTIESLGGHISLAANEPRGAVFRFSWPKVAGEII
ncbi:sensor histidine kinase [Undibacterium sp. Di27W]|uniref:sensor histidine kinase n=1 Tax=Undibacterium sp. Di27W TaxID=3413036 RepID=UPI003BF238E7